MNTIALAKSRNWERICPARTLLPDIGVRALYGDQQVAIFRPSGSVSVYAIDAMDPFSNAAVLSRGIVGDIAGEPVVASPIFKQHFSLRTGACIEQPEVAVATYPVRLNEGWIELGN